VVQWPVQCLLLCMNARALVAWNLRRVRVKRGVSQERLAYDAGVDRSYVGGLELRAKNPTIDLLDRLALKAPLLLSRCHRVVRSHGRTALSHNIAHNPLSLPYGNVLRQYP
jgi:hypothetical protein